MQIRMKDFYQCKQVLFGQYLSYEYLVIVLKGAPHILFIIYRPPKYPQAFVKEFKEVLSMISSGFDCYVIAEDFNIHIDNAEIQITKCIIAVLNTLTLFSCVHGTFLSNLINSKVNNTRILFCYCWETDNMWNALRQQTQWVCNGWD